MGKLVHKLQNGAHLAEVTEEGGKFYCRTCRVLWTSSQGMSARCIHIDVVLHDYWHRVGVDGEFADYDATIKIKMGGDDAGNSD